MIFFSKKKLGSEKPPFNMLLLMYAINRLKLLKIIFNKILYSPIASLILKSDFSLDEFNLKRKSGEPCLSKVM